MASRKQEIRKEIKKKNAKLGIDVEAAKNIVDLQDQQGENIHVDDFKNQEYTGEVLPFSTTPQKTKKGFVSRVKGVFDDERKQLKKLDRVAENIIALEAQYAAMSDEELANQTNILKQKLEDGKELDDILVEAFATVREAAWRQIHLKAFKVQLMGGIALHNGDIAEMKTGEGKTLTSIFPVYLNALTGKGVHVITVNDYLAERDARNNGKVLEFLGLTVGLNKRELTPVQKQEAHGCDVTYTTNAELGFDYLRDNMVTSMEDKVLVKGLNYALIDEVDSILIDESRTPLIISGGRKNTAALYLQADRFVKSLTAEKDYEVDVETKTVTLTPSGIEKAEKGFKIENLYDIQHTSLVHHINQALKANYAMTRDVEYMVATEDGTRDIRNAKIMIIDQFTGRVMPGRAYSDGLHQAIEAKEGVPIKEETETRATITYQNFFRLFNKLAGMTGTAKTEEEEFMMIYNMRVIEIPTNKPVIRDDRNDKIYSTKTNKFKALCAEVVARHSYGQPILIGTVSVETSETLSKMLDRRGIRHNTLNAKNHAKEAEIIARAGQMGAVTIATNMAGRGTDIKLTEESRKLGGLAVLGSERHESRRIDNQLRGRSGRQGDPGFSRFYVSLEDSLMVRFGGDKLQKLFEKMGDEQIESKAVTKSITMAQKRVEGYNFDMRKQLLDYDDVLRRQREIIYAQRNRILEADEVHDMVRVVFEKTIEQTLQANLSDQKKQTIDVAGVVKSIEMMGMAEDKAIRANELEGKSYDEVKEYCVNKIWNEYEAEIKDVKRQFLPFEKTVVLRNIDRNWINHIDMMDKLRSGIYLRSYAQNNPLQQYVQEGFDMFEEMNQRIDREITFFLLKVRIRKEHAA